MNIRVEYSNDNFSGDIHEAFANTEVLSDGTLLIEFASQTERYWRVRISNAASPVFMTLCMLGEKTELDLARSSYDPLSFQEQATVNITTGGVTAGIHEAYVEREFSLAFAKMDDTLYQKLLAWREASGAQQIFVAWETANNPDDVFLVYPTGRFHCPFISGGLYRTTTLNFKGRKAA
jgi:hypothetical protein